jgi:hypothetical protein
MPELVYSVREAIEMNGGRDKMRRVDGFSFLLPTGAGVALQGDPHDEVFIPPPTDRKLLLERKRRYHSVGLQAAELDFARLKAAIRGDGPPPMWGAESARRYESAGYSTAAEMIEVLRRIRSVVMVERAAVARIDDELGRFPEAIAERRRTEDRERLQRQIDADEMQRFMAVREVVDAINLDEEPQPEGDSDGQTMDDQRGDVDVRPAVSVSQSGHPQSTRRR